MSDGERICIRLYLDEDVHGSLGQALRQKGFDAVDVRECGNIGLTDIEQLEYAVQEDRVIFTFNAVDYIELHVLFLTTGKTHPGIVVSKQRPFGETLQRLVKLLDEVSVDEMRNQLRWLP